MKNALLLLPFAAVACAASAQSFTEGFDTGPTGWADTTVITWGNAGATNMAFSSGTWIALNNSVPVGLTGWYSDPSLFAPQGTHSGAGMLNANYNGTTGAHTIDEWMMSPVRTFNNGDTISFFTRTASPDPNTFPDRLYLKLSLVNNANPAPADFTVTLLAVNPNLTTADYPFTWTQYSATITGLSGATVGRFAFNYNVTDGGPLGNNSDVIGIDDVVYTPVPEPATIAMLGIGVAALLKRRRK